ncbi:MAG: LysR family transcriptional regulator [Rhizobiales bacterium]|nr:LysR family transcriptional regulator [Hyphomicrobiales bacterium]
MPQLLGSRIPLASLIQTLAVVDYLSFDRAARARGVSQSNVSARIKALEEDFGILLFGRNARGETFLVRHGGGIRHLWSIANRWEGASC